MTENEIQELANEAERGYDVDSIRDDEVNPRLIHALEELGREYGPLGVALVATRLTDPHVVAEILSQMAKDIRAAKQPKDEPPPEPHYVWAYSDGTGDVELFATREVAEASIAEASITLDWVEDNVAEFTSTSDLVERWLTFWADEGMELRRVEVQG